MDAIAQELRHAARRLVRSPLFTLAAVATLAIAIGANAAIFAVVERIVLNPLPYPDSDRLIEIDHGAILLRFRSGLGLTPGLYYQYLERARTLESIAVYRSDDVTLSGDDREPERIHVARATPSLSTVLRSAPIRGRWFVSSEGVPGGAPKVVLSYALWMRRYHGDAGVLGRPIAAGGVPTEVVGIMPPAFAFPDPRTDAWIVEPLSREMGFGIWTFKAVARVRDAATIENVREELTGLIADVPRAFPGDQMAVGNIQTKLFPVPRLLKEATIGGVAKALWVLLASVALVLLVGCANVANLFLARSEARQREVAVRRALGATRPAIARYFLAESLVLSAAGGVIGFAIATVAVRILVRTGPATLPRLGEVRLDSTGAAFTLALTVLAAVAFGAIPLWRTAHLSASLHDGGRTSTASAGRHRARHILMAAQAAIALVLLVSSGLMIRSFQNLRRVDPGFDPQASVTFTIGLADRDYPSVGAAVAAHHAILDRLAVLPGVRSASASSCLPLAGGCYGNTVRVEGRVLPPDAIPPVAMLRAVAGGYFETMGIRLVRGRAIDRGSVERAEPVVVVNQAFVEQFFPDGEPLGRRIASNRAGGLIWLTIVGVVADTPTQTLAEPHRPQVYMPMSISGGPGIPRTALVGPDIAVMTYVVRSAMPSSNVLPPIRRAIDEVDRNVPIARVRTLQEIVDAASAQTAFTMVLLAIAASVTLLLGAIGIYGVTAYIVGQRTGEIGVRLALGAQPAQIASMIARQSGSVAAGGVAAGLAAAYAGSRIIESLLYAVSPRDPAVFATTTILLLGVALMAGWIPARRASRLNPLDALRSE